MDGSCSGSVGSAHKPRIRSAADLMLHVAGGLQSRILQITCKLLVIVKGFSLAR